MECLCAYMCRLKGDTDTVWGVKQWLTLKCDLLTTDDMRTLFFCLILVLYD